MSERSAEGGAASFFASSLLQHTSATSAIQTICALTLAVLFSRTRSFPPPVSLRNHALHARGAPRRSHPTARGPRVAAFYLLIQRPGVIHPATNRSTPPARCELRGGRA